MMRNIQYVLLSSLVFVLGACAYALESSNQDISFITPGAEDARCYVYVQDVKYKVFPPQTVNIKKSDQDMIIRCNAPGNRMREMAVPAEISSRAVWGTPVGAAWDYASQSMFYYPSVIAIDFSQEKLIPNKLPKHNNKDIKQPEEYDLEEFLPSSPRLNSDKHELKTPLLRKGDAYSDQAFDEMGSGQDAGSKGDLNSVIEGLTAEGEGEVGGAIPVSEGTVNTGSEGLSGEPVSLYPGQ